MFEFKRAHQLFFFLSFLFLYTSYTIVFCGVYTCASSVPRVYAQEIQMSNARASQTIIAQIFGPNIKKTLSCFGFIEIYLSNCFVVGFSLATRLKVNLMQDSLFSLMRDWWRS